MATKDHHQLLVDWLKAAYTMETTLINMLDNQAERTNAFPDLHNRLEEHRKETERHAELVKGCITRLGGDVSQIRKGISKMLGEAQSQMIGGFDDSIAKDTLVSSATEEFEIATYKAIITLAKKLGDTQTVEICEEILGEEEAMLNFLDDNLENVIETAYDQNLLIS